ncbi:MAG: ligase-associated DNA damage response endonuclease PdeM [Rhodobacteraceae bacterium]|nr:ligase-associated DNA damage response endonuclease PdeM [Paracoccaceae bacterium]
MNGFDFTLCGAALTALPSGALWWAAARMLIVTDLHLGRSERYARRGGALLPPYETRDTLARLDADMQATGAATILCLGDSFDDSAAAGALDESDLMWLTRLMAGRRWLWVEGNHDPGPLALGGTHLAQHRAGPLTFRHIAEPGAVGEVSGHYHPKATLSARGQRLTRPCFLIDADRTILPAYGTYTGGMSCTDPLLRGLMRPAARAVLLGLPPRPVPFSGTAGQRPTTASI